MAENQRGHSPGNNTSVAGILLGFANETTMHGIPKAIRSKSSIGRLFWSIVCTAAASMFFLQFIQLLTKYYSYPKKVTIEMILLPVPFPSISLCNLRNLDIMVLNRLNRIFKEEHNPLDWINRTDDEFISAYMKTVSKYYPLFQRNDSDMSIFQTVLSRTTIATNIDRQIVSNAGVPFKEFIVTCRLSGHACNRTKDFVHFFDSYYYNCFTYNAPKPENPDDTLAEGLENGWSTTVLTGSGMLETNDEIRIIPGTHENLSPMSSSEGVRVVIHPPDTTPYPHTEGFDVPPGYSVTFGVKAMQNIRIGPPHGNCSEKNPFASSGQDHYRLISCQKQCLQQAIVARCGCKDIALPGADSYPDTFYCSSDHDFPEICMYEPTQECTDSLHRIFNRFLCSRETAMKIARNATATRECGCYPPCHELTYDVTYSLSKWPAANFDGDEAYIDIFVSARYPYRFSEEIDGIEKYNMYRNYFDPVNRRKAMKDFSRLNVYIADSNILKTEESEDYAQSQLLSDIGGQLGLWVGVSVISLAEVLELIIELLKYISCRQDPNSQGRQFSKDPEEQERFQPPPADGHHCCCCCCANHPSNIQTKDKVLYNHGHHGNGFIPMAAVGLASVDPGHL